MSKRLDFALITKDGIYFNKFYYSTAKAIRQQWFLYAHLHGSWKIPILYENHRYIEVIYDGEILMANLLPTRTIFPQEELDKYFIQYELLRRVRKRIKKIRKRI